MPQMNRKFRFSLIIFLLLVTFNVKAQQQITGKVLSANGKPIADVNVIASAVSNLNKVYAYSITDDDGKYSLSFNIQEDSVRVSVTGFNVATHTFVIPSGKKIYNITVKEEAQQLKEVEVKAKKIYSNGDTINYNVASYSTGNDFSIGDVLKRMPGIDVSESGAVSVKGKSIEHLYIDGTDLMKDRYGIATNNLDPNNIATVQVLENHQDIKALKELTPSDKVSINLKLKEGAKNVLNIIGNGGVGYGDKMLWDNSVITTLFSKKPQFFVTYKNNNTGEDLSQELQSFDYEEAAPYQGTLTGVTFPASPAISKNKYYFNRSHSITLNHVCKLGKDEELGINGVYSYEHEDRSGLTSQSHMLNDNSIYRFNEVNDGVMRSHNINGDLSYYLNDSTIYLKEALKFDYGHVNGLVNTFNKMNIKQKGNLESYSLMNVLSIIKTYKNLTGYSFRSTISWTKNPHSLQVTPNLFGDSTSTNDLYQHVEMYTFNTDNHFGLEQAIVLGKVLLTPCAILKYKHDKLNSNLHGFRDRIYDNLLTMDDWKTGVDMSLRYPVGNFEITASCPLVYRFMNLKQENSALNEKSTGFFFEPNFNIRYQPGSSTEMTVNGGIYNSVPSIENLYCEPVMSTYRSMTAYSSSNIFTAKTYSCGYSFNYKDIFNMLFCGFDLKYNHGCPEMLYGTEYKGDVENVTSNKTNSAFNSCEMTVRASKGFDWKRMKVSMSAGYHFFNQPILLQNEECRYKGNTFAVNSNVSLQLFDGMELSYDVAYENRQTQMDGGDAVPRMITVSNKLKASWNITKKWGVTMDGYHFYDNLNDDNKNFLMADAGMFLTIKHVRFTLNFNNILNKTTYSYSRITDLSTYRYTSNIRPRSIMLKIRFKIL